MKFKFDLQQEKRWFMDHKPGNKVFFILLGIVSTIWFIIRVVPKPSRATYPCMQAAAPFAGAFITYLSGLLISVAAYRRISSFKRRKNFIPAISAMIVLCLGFILMTVGDSKISNAGVAGIIGDEPPNEPMGVARGIYPGRVAWVWNPMATDETCTNTPGDYWFQDDNVDTEVIGDMLSRSLQLLSGETNDSLAWDALFRSYNESHGNGNIPYQAGQKIAIKVNLTTGGWGNIDYNTYDKTLNLEMMDGTPQLIVAMLKQLIEVFGVAQEDISIGDPIRIFYNQYWDQCHPLFPDVKYLDLYGFHGRTKVIKTDTDVLKYSDGTVSDSLPTAYTEASYMINMGCLKQHDLAGGTFCAKNHFGSTCRGMAMHLHYSLPSPTSNGFENLGFGKFRNLVDLMEHKDLGEKTVLFLIDGIWGGELPVSEPVKWQMNPFNNDWPNSIMVSQDHVAIESVGLDFVRAEFDEYADMFGADDYLHQAADSANWAEGIIYDPEGDGLIIESLGVHEHWNNDVDKQYTRNLGIGDGIELIKYLITGVDDLDDEISMRVSAFPNPFRENLTIEYSILKKANVTIEVYDTKGRRIEQYIMDHLQAGTYAYNWNASALQSGLYVCYIRYEGANGVEKKTVKLMKL